MTKSLDEKNLSADWSVYIVRCADNSLYTGISNDVERRVCAHNLGRGAKYTRARRPVTLVYQEVLTSKSDALKREHAIKKLSLQRKRSLVRTGAPA